jgi:2-oxoglutarate ferredoxin oxidoreductase subunit beta
MRRNVDVKFMLFDNRIYGLTKGQYSPTSELGKKTKSTPYGSVDRPFNPVALALGAGATFVARSVDTFTPHLKETLAHAHAHRGTAFVQIFQNCNIFNDGAFDHFREKANRDDNLLQLQHGEPLLFGKNLDRGIRIGDCYRPEVVELGHGVSEKNLPTHDQNGPPGYLMMLAEMAPPQFPLPVGVIRRVKIPSFEAAVHEQIERVTSERGPGDLRQALHSANTWEVK